MTEKISSNMKTQILNDSDLFFQSKGFVRLQIPKDQNSLFRAIAEIVYRSQHLHRRVRLDCFDYFNNMWSRKGRPFREYLKCLHDEKSFGGSSEIWAAVNLYKIKVLKHTANQNSYKNYDQEVKWKVYEDPKIDYPETNVLRLFFTPPCHFDLIYTEEQMGKMAVAQAFVYQTMFVNLYQFDENILNATVKAMIQDKVFVKVKKQQKKTASDSITNEIVDELTSKPMENLVWQTLSNGKITTPFPYKYAKALDPSMYRNIDMDHWMDKFKNHYL